MQYACAALAMQAGAPRTAHRYQNVAIFDTDSKGVGIDNRCSACISDDIDDFEGAVHETDRVIKGFGGTRTTGVKVGTLKWKWHDDEGKLHTFRIPNSYYVPNGEVKLLSPQHWAKEMKDTKPIEGTGEETNSKEITLYWNQRKHKLTIPLAPTNNVATLRLAPGYTKYQAFCAEAGYDDDDEPVVAQPATLISDDEDEATSEVPIDADLYCEPCSPPTPTTPSPTEFDLNGTEEQRKQAPVIIEEEEDRQPTTEAAEFLKIHQQFGHASFKKLRVMAQKGVIHPKFKNANIPVCSACLYAKATRRQWRSKTSKNRIIKKATRPGQCVSVDQLVSPTPGLIAQLTGRLTTKRYKYATVFVDQYSGMGYTYLQQTATAEETIKAKKAFEAFAATHGVFRIEAYHADNGIFRANLWQQHCRNQGQPLTFAGVNAHHTNGAAEKRIRDIQELARTMLIHANRRWPAAITTNLWPYAIRMATDVINNTPRLQDQDKREPVNIFSSTRDVQINSKHWKPFGCPVYVLENELQAGQIYHKWRDRAKVGIYLGKSPQHARNVALVLNLTTGLVSPQFHIQFDPSFHTVNQEKFTSSWQLKAGFISQREKAVPKRKTEEAAFRKEREPPNKRRRTTRSEGVSQSEGAQQSIEQPIVERISDPQQNQQLNPDEATDQTGNLPSEGGTEDQTNRTTTTRSGRQTKKPNRLIEAMIAELENQTIPGELLCYEAMYPHDEDPMLKDPLLAFKAVADPDTMYMHQAMKQPDKGEFVKAMLKEIQDQQGVIWTITHKDDVPEEATILPAVWQMKRKRDIKTREIKKHKARLNIDGSRMVQGVHYDQNYAPVASWNSIRTLLAMTAVHKWHTKQLDYVLAFPQAPSKGDLYMKIPKGFTIDQGKSDDYLLKLKKNLYGTKNAGRVWNEYLTKKLIKEVGFVQSEVDECVFYRGKTMYVLYTDDSIIAGPDEDELDEIIEDIKRAKLNITIEGDLQDFLGVNIDRKADGTIHLTQPHLIDQIIEDLGLDDKRDRGSPAKTKDTPASSSKLLTKHLESPPFDGHFNYRSVLGKCNYLEKGSRSDIAYIVHQCARFSSDPRREHGEALKWLGRYLKATRDRGTIIKPNAKQELEVYVDANFAGDWHPDYGNDEDTARSRHGYIIQYANCPILWKSQLQGEITLSSTESEYTGISYALRDAIPIMQLLDEMKAMGFPIRTANARVHCRVFEDNAGALEMASIHKYRPRTKHICTKLHHFRSYVTSKQITIHPIKTDYQRADYLTKPVNETILKRLRKLVMGW